MRSLAALPVLLGALLLVVCPRALADDATYQRLVDRATRVLKEAEAYQRAGRRDLARERARRAAALIAQADRQKPADANAAFLGVQAAVFAEDAAAARLWLGRYTQRSPYGERDPNLHYARAMIWLLLDGRPAEAVQNLDRMAAVSPRGLTRPAHVLLYRALTALGGGLADAGHVDEAVRRFKRASQVARRLGDARRDVAARANGAITLLEFGRADDAEKLFASLHAEYPANPVFAFYLGRCLRLQERFAEAAALLEKAAQAVDGGRVGAEHAGLLHGAHLELGIALREAARRAGDPARQAEARRRARRAFERFTVLQPRSAQGWQRLGRLLAEDLEQPHEAIAHLERAHQLDPACDGALRLLIRIAGRHGPPAGTTAEAWRERRAAWEREFAAHADRWKAERARRRTASRTGADGCP